MSFDCLATLMTPFIDSHCHLTDPAFAQDLDAVISRMKNASMTAAVTIGCEDRDIEPLRALLDRFPGFLFGAWAVHPEYPDAREADADEIAERASEHLKPLEALSTRADMSVLRATLLSRKMPNCAPLPQPFRLKNS